MIQGLFNNGGFMRKFIMGFIFGIIVGGTFVVYADVGVLFGSNNVEKGVATNPLYVQGV